MRSGRAAAPRRSVGSGGRAGEGGEGDRGEEQVPHAGQEEKLVGHAGEAAEDGVSASGMRAAMVTLTGNPRSRSVFAGQRRGVRGGARRAVTPSRRCVARVSGGGGARRGRWCGARGRRRRGRGCGRRRAAGRWGACERAAADIAAEGAEVESGGRGSSRGRRRAGGDAVVTPAPAERVVAEEGAPGGLGEAAGCGRLMGANVGEEALAGGGAEGEQNWARRGRGSAGRRPGGPRRRTRPGAARPRAGGEQVGPWARGPALFLWRETRPGSARGTRAGCRPCGRRRRASGCSGRGRPRGARGRGRWPRWWRGSARRARGGCDSCW